MPKQRWPGAAAGLALMLTPAAAAVDLPFTGTLEIGGPLVPVTVNASGVADFDPSTRTARFPGSIFAFSATQPVGTTLVARFDMTGKNGPATIFSNVTSVVGRMALVGVFRARLNAPPATVASVTLPLQVIGGPQPFAGTFFFTTSGSAESATIRGASTWRTGMVTATGGTGAVATARGSNQRTAGGGGRLQLVTPVVISTAEGGVPNGAPPGFARLTLDFVPEPDAALLLAAAALLLLGWAFRGSRQRSRAHLT